MDPVDRTRHLRSEDLDLRPQKDRKMGFCEFIKAFQKAHRLKADGKTGPETIAALGNVFKSQIRSCKP